MVNGPLVGLNASIRKYKPSQTPFVWFGGGFRFKTPFPLNAYTPYTASQGLNRNSNHSSCGTYRGQFGTPNASYPLAPMNSITDGWLGLNPVPSAAQPRSWSYASVSRTAIAIRRGPLPGGATMTGVESSLTFVPTV